MKIWVVNADAAAAALESASREVSALLSIRDPGAAPIADPVPSGVSFCELRFGDVPAGRIDGPTVETVSRGIEWLRTQLDRDETLLIHCNQGISRSTAFGAVALLLQGEPESRIFHILPDFVAHKRPSPHPDVLALADELLGSSLVRSYKRDMSASYRMWTLCNS